MRIYESESAQEERIRGHKQLSPEEKQKAFYSGGISDRLLYDDGERRGIVYMKFFEADEPYRGSPWSHRYDVLGELGFRVFPTRNGFHVVGNTITNARGKREWFSEWKSQYPRTDYRMQTENVLAPRSPAETEFIFQIIGTMTSRIVRYYRDKAVFESWADRRAKTVF
jgi:hypothetical protein